MSLGSFYNVGARYVERCMSEKCVERWTEEAVYAGLDEAVYSERRLFNAVRCCSAVVK